MTTELRSTTFTIKVNVDGKEKIVEVTRAVSDLDGAEKSIKATLGDVASVTTSVTKSQKELNQQARVAVTEAERQHKQTKRVVDEYKNLNKALTMSAEDAQVFNAQMRAGVDPMSAQGQQIAKLVKEHQQLAAAQGNQQGSLRNARGVMQNFGWQMQDTIVQLQMGTSAFTVLSQQGSQMAAAFGPTGAIVGAFIALAGVVGGSLFASLLDSKTAMQRLEEGGQSLNKTLSIGKGGVAEYTDKLRELYRVSESAAKARLTIDLSQANAQMETAAKGMRDALSGATSWVTAMNRVLASLHLNNEGEQAATAEWLSMLTSDLTGLSGAAANQAAPAVMRLSRATRDLSKNITPEKVAEFEAAMQALLDVSDLSKESVRGMFDSMLEMVSAYKAGKVTSEELTKKLSDLASGTADFTNSAAESEKATNDLIKSLADEYLKLTMSEEAYTAYKDSLVAADDATRNSIATLREKNREAQRELDMVKAMQEHQAELKRVEDERAKDQQRAAAARENDARRSAKYANTTELINAYNKHLSAMNTADVNYATKKYELDKWVKESAENMLDDSVRAERDLANEKLAITKSIYGDMKEFALVEREAQYLKELAMAQKHGLNLRDVMANYQKDVADIESRYNDEKKSGLDAWLESAEKALSNHDKLVEQSLDRFTSGFGDAFANSIMGAESVGDAFKGMFEGMASSMLKYFGEWAAQEMMMFLLKSTLAKTEIAGNVAVAEGKSKQNAYEAAAAAYKSAAEIPVVGWALAPAAGAAAFTAVSAFGSNAIAGAQAAIPTYDKGGVIPTKGYGIVSEFGDELVGGTLVYNNTPNGLNVTGREDTAKLLSGNRSTTNNVTINSSGNASPEAIGRAVDRVLRRKSKKTDTAVYDSMNRGRKNRGARFNA